MDGLLFIDYETYYDDEYSLSKMTRTEYLNDERFKVHGAAVAIDDEESRWVTADDLPAWFAANKHRFRGMVCFNGLFDHAITALHYVMEEKFLIDPCTMARTVLGTRYPDMRFSLGALSRALFPNNPELWKDEDALGESKGVFNLPPAMEARIGRYACQDNKVQRAIFKAVLRMGYPWDTGLVDMHLTMAMGVYPQLRMDTVLAAAIHASEVKAKDEAVAKLQVERADLRSNDKFAALLAACGVEPPTKYSDKQKKYVYAFAKTDEAFKELLEHDDPRVQALCEVRLGEKANQKLSRAALFARLPIALPVPLKFAAAHTGRHGGEEYNLQNLERGGDLRGCIRAPQFKRMLVRDLSQIELRMNAWWCGETWLVELLRAGGDPYCALATHIYGREITKADEDERFVGKQGELASGYQAGDERILSMLKQKGVTWATAELAKKVKVNYRGSHKAIVAMWEWLQKWALPAIAGIGGTLEHKGVRFEKGSVLLPSGRRLWYPELHVNEEGDWVYRVNKRRNKGQQWKKIFGGALLENIIQAMSYDVFMFHARKAWAAGYRMALAVHDEMGFVVPEVAAEKVNNVIAKIQTMAPAWCADIPLKGEGGFGTTYLDAKP